MILLAYQEQQFRALPDASRPPQRCGGFALLGCSTNSACQSVMNFLSVKPPSSRIDSIMPAPRRKVKSIRDLCATFGGSLVSPLEIRTHRLTPGWDNLAQRGKCNREPPVPQRVYNRAWPFRTRSFLKPGHGRGAAVSVAMSATDTRAAAVDRFCGTCGGPIQP